MGISNSIKRIIFREKSSSDEYIKFLRKKGVKVGERTTIFSPRKVFIDIQRPWLLEIGDDVQITYGVTILTHGYDWAVLKGKYGDVLGSSKKVRIGNNVFIGMNTTILKGVTVGNNVIIGAASLVNKSIPDNVVVAGNPARVIMTLEEYYEKRKNKQLEEAKETAIEYYNTYGKVPPKEIMYEFFWIFEKRSDLIENEKFKDTMELVGNFEQTMEKYKKTEPIFEGYKEFLKYCNIIERDKNENSNDRA